MKKKNFLILLCTVTTLSLSIMSCSDGNPKTAGTLRVTVIANTYDSVARGKYLVTIMGCNDCHSPKKMGPQGPEVIPELALSGYPAERPIVKFDSKLIKTGFAQFYPDLTAAAGPWGISFAANLTPDATGIGNWKEEQFITAIRQGKSKGLAENRMLLPPMPWQDFASLTNEDAHALFIYLKSLKPVKNTVPGPVTPDKM